MRSSAAKTTSALERALGHEFRDRALLQQALTHASYAREAQSQNLDQEDCLLARDNEQMEFLGDAVLSYVVSQELFRRFPEFHEGELSKLRAHLVSARNLLQPAQLLKVGRNLRLGRGEERSGGRLKSTLLTDALEALIAALYLDGGMEAAQRFILKSVVEPGLAEVHQDGSKQLPVMDYKSALQEMAHSTRRQQPRYRLVREEGPDHRKVFTAEACIPAAADGGRAFVRRGKGNTKKLAEQVAARKAWEHLQSLQESPKEAGPSSGSHE